MPSSRGPIVLHVAAEVSPFHKSGGLGDVLGGLPTALGRAGIDTRIITGLFGADTKLASIGGRSALVTWPFTIDIWLAGKRLEARVHEARTHGGEVTTYFLEAPHLSRGGLYGHGDDVYRFAILAKGAVAIASALIRPPDAPGFAERDPAEIAVLHAHDWHTALAIYYARRSPLLRRVPSIFTIHNLAFQGVAEPSTAHYLDIGPDDFRSGFEHHGALNLMKGAILAADRVTTVSGNYAREIQTARYGQDLDGLLRHVDHKLRGIPNGIDVRSWDPTLDPALPAHFSANDLEGKALCRSALQFETGLAQNEHAPLLGIVSRFSSQKGIDLLCDAAPAHLAAGGQLVALGEGDAHLEDRFARLAARHRGAVSYSRAFDDGLSRRIYAGSDLFAMPSRFEPCGLAQMYAMRYGTIPVARATGGLVDTIYPLHNRYEVGGASGIVYRGEPNDPGALLGALHWARDVCSDRSALEALRWNAMHMDHSWDLSAKHYIHMYLDLGADLPIPET